ncbi:cysteine hydrolase family protein [Niabella drilacis]|uniref:Isochorismatase family protein n=1 Tax=Niabella drilacis (strain DSM 25811 / CCM 8410 / CCUG 62505 / LMG 26954 / E90) TaxID=1285928 RepID=A0A1G6JWC7_NIADE|nr:isochorismatase family cysteine hydrolase [Niabella drilacis]SDC22705.1 Isochorismatase family protein [Niabella drilacis]
MSKTRIIIIDAQKDFTEPGFAYGKKQHALNHIGAVVQKLDGLLEQTQPGQVILVYSSYIPNQFEAGFSACIPGTEGHKLSLKNIQHCQQFEKKGHSCFSSNRFCDHLRQQQADHLILCGFLTEYCVKATALDAISEGFRVTLYPDLIGSADEKQAIKEQELQLLAQKGADIHWAGHSAL